MTCCVGKEEKGKGKDKEKGKKNKSAYLKQNKYQVYLKVNKEKTSERIGCKVID